MTKNLLRVKNLSIDVFKQNKVLRVLSEVSWTLKAGEILGIVGESGSGKTMMALSILNLLPSAAKRIADLIEFEGENLLEKNEEAMRCIRGQKIGYIFQEPSRSFDPLQSIGRSLIETLKVHSQTPYEALWEEACRLLQDMQIPDARSRMQNFPHQFSGGMLQRVMIALALAQHPLLLIADEPTTSLDVTIQAEIIHLLYDLKKEKNLGLIFISHDIALISGFAERLLVMKDGLIVEEGKTKELISLPQHEYTQLLFHSAFQEIG